MRILTTIIFGFSAFSSINAAISRCGTARPSEEFQALHAAHSKQDAAERLAGFNEAIIPRAATHVVTTYAHIINAGPKEEDGNIPQGKIMKQVSLSTSFPSPSFGV